MRILIVGKAGEGKSTIAEAIRQGLSEHGLPCQVNDDASLDESLHIMNTMEERLNWLKSTHLERELLEIDVVQASEGGDTTKVPE